MKIGLFYSFFLLLLASSIYLIEGAKISLADESEVVIRKYEIASLTSLSCSSNGPVEWTLQNGTVLKPFPSNIYSPENMAIDLTNYSYLDTGYFICRSKNNINDAAKIYVYFFDGENFLAMNESLVLNVTNTAVNNVILPCRPTSPEVQVELNEEGNSIKTSYEYDSKVGYHVTKLIDKSTNFTCSARYRNSDWKHYKIQVVVHLAGKNQIDPDKPHEKSNSGFLAVVKEYTYDFDVGVAIFLVILPLSISIYLTKLTMRKRRTLSSNAGVSVDVALWGDKIIQTTLQQNAKITDKLETLSNQQELLCNNQSQLLEMISTWTKKVDALIIPEYYEYLDKLAVNQGSSTKSSTTISGTPPTSTATPARPSYHIPMPDSSVVQSCPPIQIPQDDKVEPVEHEPIPDFKPFIPLPDEVVIKTGEKGEQVVYENHVKLFRFVDIEWKEQGIGTYKLLKNPDTGRLRALMRREMVHEVCANHLLSEKNELIPMKSSDRAWTYCAADYADSEMKYEQFCIIFKTPEDAAKFKSEFDKYRDEGVLAARNKKEPLNKSTATPTSVHGTLTPPSAKSAEPKATVVSTETPKKSNDSSKFTPRSGLLFGTPTTPKTESPVAQSAPTVAKTTPAAAKPFGSESTFAFGAPKLPSSPASAGSSPVTAPAQSAETTKPSVFAGFSMNTLPKPTASITNISQQQQQQQPPSSTTTKSESATTEPAPFTCVSDDVMTFSSLSQSSGNAFTKSKYFKGFDGAGSLVFDWAAAEPSAPVAAILKHILPLSPQSNSSNVSTPTQDFSPVIPLPELIDVKTGEEGQEVLYKERCKLYRYTGEEWKERGVGNMKILRDPVSGYVRLLMRREQVRKVCCNHRLLKEYELKQHKTTDKAWTWCAQDYSENELKNETFCVKFKHTELANAFRDAFNRAKSNLESPQKASFSDSASSKTKTAEAALPKVSDMFKPETGSWECKKCYVHNEGDIDTCLSCASPRNPSSEQKSSPEEGKKAESAFVDNKSETSGGGSASKFSFGMPVSNKQDNSSVTPTPTPAAAPAAPAKQFSFCIGSSSFNFGNSSGGVTQSVTKDTITNLFQQPPSSTTTKSESATTEPAPFTCVSDNAMTFSLLSQSSGDAFPNWMISSKTQKGSDDDDEVVKNDRDPYFEPVIPLPDIVEVESGEENEEIKFCERAKLFRFDIENKQWKERGIGELKVLYHPVEKSYRLLLRREQVHKVVLNQRIANYLNLQPSPSSHSSWCWSSMNFPEQESEPVLEILAAKFKTEAQATAFHNVVQESLFDINTVQKYEFVHVDDKSAATVQNPNESGAASECFEA